MKRRFRKIIKKKSISLKDLPRLRRIKELERWRKLWKRIQRSPTFPISAASLGACITRLSIFNGTWR